LIDVGGRSSGGMQVYAF